MPINRETVLRQLNCPADQYPQQLAERYPHVLEKLVGLWGSAEATSYLADLLNPNFSGGRFDRDGFPRPVWLEIMRLADLHSKLRSR